MKTIEKRIAWALSSVEPLDTNFEAHLMWKSSCHAIANQLNAGEAFLNACYFDYWKTHALPRGIKN